MIHIALASARALGSIVCYRHCDPLDRKRSDSRRKTIRIWLIRYNMDKYAVFAATLKSPAVAKPNIPLLLNSRYINLYYDSGGASTP